MDNNYPVDGQESVAVNPRRTGRRPLKRKSMKTKSYRWMIGSATSVLTAIGVSAYVDALSGGGINVFEAFSVVLFVVLFAWIAFSFVVATVGFARRLRPDPAATPPSDPRPSTEAVEETEATAVLVPVYNESPGDVFARIEAMMRDLAAKAAASTSPNPRFDFFVLSDSTETEVWLAEEWAWADLKHRLGEDVTGHCQVFYRHRSENKGRKAGNIADFCERWSRPYALMIVLDADSLMSAETMVAMVRRMSADDRLGILQVPPVPIGRASLFARLQQFSAQAYGPVFVEGFRAWSGDQGNYWGHNAIIRVAAFCDCCDLPVLPGQAPLGGEILSHDFVEASLLVRRGWKVLLATELGGSYEECPTTLTDYAMRDQRWCQGNLQHGRLILSDGFHPVSRLHFASGVMAYVASPLWILFTLLCVGGWAIDAEALGSASWFDVYGRFVLFAAAMLMLLIPKLYGVLGHVVAGDAGRFGGSLRIAAGGLVETFWSVLLSPLMAVLHSRFVVSTLRGRKVRWAAQQRGEHGVTFTAAFRDYGVITLLGVLAGWAIFWGASPLLVWFAPILAGLLLAIPMAMLLGSRGMGLLAKRMGLLLIPQEIAPPEVARLYRDAREVSSKRSGPRTAGDGSLLATLLHSPTFFMIHQDVLSASESDTPMREDERAEVLRLTEEAWDQLPQTLRRRLLSDAGLLRQLHIRTRAAIPAPMTA